MKSRRRQRSSKGVSREMGDWESFNGSTQLQNIGLGIAGSIAPPVYGDQTNVVPNSLITFLIAAQSPQPQSGNLIPVGAAEIGALEFDVEFAWYTPQLTSLLTHARANIGIGLYRSAFDRSTIVWSTRDPLSFQDTSRDDWLARSRGSYILPSITMTQASEVPILERMPRLSVRLPRPFKFGQGACLGLGLSVQAFNGAVPNPDEIFSVAIRVYVRAKFTKIW